MAMDYGKAFESRFKLDWEKSFPNTILYRIPDGMSGFKYTSENVSDFFAFNNKHLWFVEVKSHKGVSIPFSAIPQYERLLAYKDFENVIPIIIIWFREHDKVIAVPIQDAEKIVKSGKKSIGLNALKDSNYNIIEIPSNKKRVFMESDYTILKQLLKQGE